MHIDLKDRIHNKNLRINIIEKIPIIQMLCNFIEILSRNNPKKFQLLILKILLTKKIFKIFLLKQKKKKINKIMITLNK